MIKLQGDIQPQPHKWDKVEIAFLLKYYPAYKRGDRRYSAGWLRGQLKNRTMAALSRKYWGIMGAEHKEKIAAGQIEFDFLREKITNGNQR